MLRYLAVPLLAAAPIAAQWTQTTPTTDPGNVSYPAMAYDSSNGVCVLFGGLAQSGLSQETWLYDGTDWSLANPTTSPPARREAAMAYDSVNGKVVLFGGRGASGELADTWEWDGTNWTQTTPATSPSRRQGHSMCYDVVNQQVVLFGGSRNPDFCFPVLTDTWLYRDGMNWTQVADRGQPADQRPCTAAWSTTLRRQTSPCTTAAPTAA